MTTEEENAQLRVLIEMIALGVFILGVISMVLILS